MFTIGRSQERAGSIFDQLPVVYIWNNSNTFAEIKGTKRQPPSVPNPHATDFTEKFIL